MNPIVGFSFSALFNELTILIFLFENLRSFLFVHIMISDLVFCKRFVTCLFPMDPYPTTKIFKLISYKINDK